MFRVKLEIEEVMWVGRWGVWSIGKILGFNLNITRSFKNIFSKVVFVIDIDRDFFNVV